MKTIYKNSKLLIEELNGWKSLSDWKQSVEFPELLSEKQKKIYDLKDTDVSTMSDSDYEIIYLEKVKDNTINELKPNIDSYLDFYCDNNFIYKLRYLDKTIEKFKDVQFQANRQTVYDVTSSLTVLNELPKDGSIKYNWRSKDNINQSFLTFDDFKNFAISMGLFYNKMFGIRSYLKDDLINKSLSQLESYNIETEWLKLVNT